MDLGARRELTASTSLKHSAWSGRYQGPAFSSAGPRVQHSTYDYIAFWGLC